VLLQIRVEHRSADTRTDACGLSHGIDVNLLKCGDVEKHRIVLEETRDVAVSAGADRDRLIAAVRFIQDINNVLFAARLNDEGRAPIRLQGLPDRALAFQFVAGVIARVGRRAAGVTVFSGKSRSGFRGRPPRQRRKAGQAGQKRAARDPPVQ
jgi:hypothetical protein